MRIGVVVPAYNAARFIGEALESVLGQTVPPDSVVVVDDGSVDDTCRVVSAFGPGVSLVRAPHRGIAATRNAGVASIDCDVLAFIDADDRWIPDKLERQRDALASEAAAGFVICHMMAFATPGLPESEREALLAQQPVPFAGWSASALLVRRSTFLRVGDFAEDLAVGETIDWFSRARHLGVIGRVLPEVLVERRLHRDNTTRVQRRDHRDYLAMAKRHLDRSRGG
jgi:glycosyltransferase involved in cell wall biosynthesis